MDRAPCPGDCAEICEGLNTIDIDSIIQPFDEIKWEHGLYAFRVTNLEATPVIIPLRELARLCSRILQSLSETWCEEYIEGKQHARLAIAMTAEEEDSPRYSSYTSSLDSLPLPTLSPRNIALALIWGSSLILF